MKSKRVLRLFPMLFVAASLAAPLAWARDLPTASPEEVGMSAERLARIGTWLESEVERKKIPGAVLLVARQGKVVYHEAVGVQDPESGAPMAKDSIFRIYSMTKPIVTVAAMMLVEEGRLLLESPVSTHIPSFKDMKVAVEKADPADGAPKVEMEPARRPITVHDLMRHTSGLTYGFFGDSPAKRAYIEARIGSDDDLDNAGFADRIATMPLGFHPGTTWDYSYSTDVLGRVIEVIEGKPLGAVLEERVFRPLGMVDTGFHVADASKHSRIAEAFPDDRTIGTGISFYDPRVQSRFESGGGGLSGTAPDYARFAQALLNGGELDGKRLLSPATLAFMASDHLGASISKGKLYLPGAGYGFGLGFGVRTAAGESPFASSVGEYYWGGAGGTYFWVDPKQELFAVFMMQSPKNRVPYRSVLRNMVYAAIVD